MAEIDHAHASSVSRKLKEPGFDVAIRISEVKDASHVARNLMKIERVVCASPIYLETAGRPAGVRDLKSHNCVISDIKGGGGRWYYRRAGSSGSVAVSGSLRANQGDAIVEAVKCGLGVALLPLWLVKNFLRTAELTRLFADHAWGFSKNSNPVLQLVYPHRKAISRTAKIFVDFAMTELGRSL